MWAARALAGTDCRTNPEVIEALITAAHKDPAPTVRAECVRTLVTTGTGLIRLDELFQELRRDQDPRVREAVDQALMYFSTRDVAVK